jgi:chromosome segregation ATPase
MDIAGPDIDQFSIANVDPPIQTTETVIPVDEPDSVGETQEDRSDSDVTEDSYESLEMAQNADLSLSHDVVACSAEIEALRNDLNQSQEEVLNLRSQLEEKMSVKADLMDESSDVYELRLEEMKQVCVALQDRVYQAETAEKQLREKLKLAEYTINDLESSENSARENLDMFRKSETEYKKSLSSCQQRIHELKEIILDKDVNENNLAEKVL